MNEIPSQVLVALVSAIFGAGVAWGAMRARDAQTRKDVNALGGVLRRHIWNSILAHMVTLDNRDDRQRLADLVRMQ